MITIAMILEVVSWRFDVQIDIMKSASRTTSAVAARHAACYLLRTMRPDLSLEDIGIALGGMHHTSVLYAVRKVGEWMTEDERTERTFDAMRADITARADTRHLISPSGPIVVYHPGRDWWNEQAECAIVRYA